MELRKAGHRRRVRALGGGAVLAALALGFCMPASGGNGVFEINQACVQSGCFPGDGPGFPVTITGALGTTNSYRLTSDLTTLSPAQNAIEVSRAGARIDLGGFQITCFRVGIPSGQCEPGTGTGAGVVVVQDAFRNVTVRNGRIFHMAGDGLFLGDGARVEQVDVQENGSRGIRVGEGSIVRESTVAFSDNDGIIAGSGSLVADNAIVGNGDDGIVTGNGCVVTGNTVAGSRDEGIRAPRSHVSGNVVSENGGRGIVVLLNGSVRANTTTDNEDFQLVLGSGVSFGDNSIEGDSTVSGGFDTGGNVCNGGSCP